MILKWLKDFTSIVTKNGFAVKSTTVSLYLNLARDCNFFGSAEYINAPTNLKMIVTIRQPSAQIASHSFYFSGNEFSRAEMLTESVTTTNS